MTDTTENPQKFMIKLPPKLHRELMAYAGLKGKALSDIIVGWIEGAWENQPERKKLVELLNSSTPEEVAPVVASPEEEPAAKPGSVTELGKPRLPAKAKKAPKEK